MNANRYHLTACEVIPDPFPFRPKNPTDQPVRYYRIMQNGKFVGGEWCDAKVALRWAARQVRGFSSVVECDQYGNLLRTKPEDR